MAEQQINSQIQTNNEELTNTITLHDIIRMVIANWYWFVLSTVCCLCAAYYYLASTPKIYSRTATILVKDSRKGGDVDLTAFSDLAGFQNRRNVDNEVFILQSRRLMTNVVKQLNLTVNYSVSERLRRRDLYGQAPIDVKFINDNDNQSLAMEITPIDDDKIRLSGFEDQFVTKHESRSVITAAYGDTIPTPVGQVVVQKSLYMAPDYIGVPIRVTKSSLGRTTNAYRAAVKSDVANKQASVVTISMNNTVPRRAEDVINTLIEAYNEDAIEDKRRVSVATGKFIKARLDVIGRELGDVDRNIEDIKKDNRMVDITSEAARSVSESSRYKTEGLSLENQINVAEYIRTYLNDPKNVGELIPAMAAAGTNTAIAKQIEDYNSAILRREKLLENSSERSPVIQDLDNLLAAVRRSIISSLDSNISTLEIQRDAMRKEETQANIRISTMPSQEKVILGITRQQKIKEELFLYLLNKQEENQLNYAVAESNSRSIDYAYGSNAPVSPRPMMILGIALIVSLAIPFGLLYLIGMLDTTIRGRKDIEENISAPFLGDIPFLEGENKGGIVVSVKGVRVFVPASQSGMPKDSDLGQMVKQKVQLRVTEVNRARRRVVGSIKAVTYEARQAAQAEIWNNIEVGKHYTGTVKSMTSYGVFVDIGGVDGMVHISELSWSRIKNPAEVVSVGDTLDVYVISFDPEKHKISLGVKDRSMNPWDKFMATYHVGDVANVRIVKLMTFGAFAEVVPGVDGLIHISQIADRRIEKPGDVLTEGEMVDAKITAIDEEKQKISLSIRALLAPAADEDADEE